MNCLLTGRRWTKKWRRRRRKKGWSRVDDVRFVWFFQVLCTRSFYRLLPSHELVLSKPFAFACLLRQTMHLVRVCRASSEECTFCCVSSSLYSISFLLLKSDSMNDRNDFHAKSVREYCPGEWSKVFPLIHRSFLWSFRTDWPTVIPRLKVFSANSFYSFCFVLDHARDCICPSPQYDDRSAGKFLSNCTLIPHLHPITVSAYKFTTVII